CQDCPLENTDESQDNMEEAAGEAIGEAAAETFQEFSSLDISGSMKVTIEQGDTYDIQFSGNDDFQEVLTTEKNDQVLTINLRETADSPVRVYITTPRLEALNLVDTDDVLVKDFTLEELTVTASGEFELKTDISVQLFTLDAQNGVEVELIGSTEQLVANLVNESRLDTDRGTVNRASLTATEGSRIKLGEGVEVQEQSISDDSNLKIVN
ncbi:MAG: DUF2807 domain-containing protein, partial [Bacteroidota bacterium]